MSVYLGLVILVLYAVAAASAVASTFPALISRLGDRASEGFRRRSITLMRMSLFSGFALQSIALAVIVVETRNIPISNLYETILFSLWLVAVVAIFVDRFYRSAPLNTFLLPLLVLLSIGALLMANRKTVAPRELNTLWLGLHIVPILAGFACFALSFTASLLYITEEHWLKVKSLKSFLARLSGEGIPPLEALERIAKRATVVGFPLYTFGLILGFLWAKSGASALSLWPPDGTVVAACITWVLYFALVHVRLAEISHGRRIAYLTVIAFVLVMLLFLAGFMLGRFHPHTVALGWIFPYGGGRAAWI